MRVIKALSPLIIVILTVYALAAKVNGQVIFQEALEKDNVTLFCDSTPDSNDDELMLLVWYKDNDSIYSYDARVETEWCNIAFNASGRLTANMSVNPTAFTITALREEDQAIYHCRVEFLLSPTRNLSVNLTVTVLPSKPFFLDELGNTVTTKTRPYYEGDTLVLTCLVIGGRPPPKISWYSGETLVDATDSGSEIPNIRQNELFLPLTRDNADKLSCKATNTRLVPSLDSSLEIELFLPPDFVRIEWMQGESNGGFIAGNMVSAKCMANGSYPAPDLIWYLNDKRLDNFTNQTLDDALQATISYVQFVPKVADHKGALRCKAVNAIMPTERNSKSDIIRLNVSFAPIVRIVHLDEKNRNEVAELDSLHLKCDIQSNPPVDNYIIWYFNDSDIRRGSIWGDNIHSDQLIVEEVTRKHTGKYSCMARNRLGETRADSINIIVLYPPECINPAISLKKETLICNVRGLPIPDTYFWHIYQLEYDPQHVTTGSASLPLDQLSGPFSNSLNVSCEADNGIASQERTCSKIIEVGYLKPLQLQQCDLIFQGNKYEITCLPVENTTHYEVSLWRLSNTNTSLVLYQKRYIDVGNRLALTQNDEPGLVRGELGLLKAGDEASVAACNRYGCSAALLLRPTQTLLNATATPWWTFFTEWNIGILIVVAILIAMFVCSTILAVRLSRRSRVKDPAPVIQVLQLDDATREYLARTGDIRVHTSLSLMSDGSDFSDGADSPTLVDYHCVHTSCDCVPPDVTLTLQRESAV